MDKVLQEFYMTAVNSNTFPRTHKIIFQNEWEFRFDNSV